MSNYSADDINTAGIHRVVLRDATPEVGTDEMVLIIYPDKVILSSGVSGMIVLSLQEAAKLASEVTKALPLDTLAEI